MEQAAVTILRHEPQLMREACLIEYLRDIIDACTPVAFLFADEEHVALIRFLFERVIGIEVTGGEDVEVWRKGRVVLLGDVAVACVEMHGHVGIARWFLRRAGADWRVIERTEVAAWVVREDVVKDIAAAHLIDEDDRIVVFDVFLPVTVPMTGCHTVREL